MASVIPEEAARTKTTDKLKPPPPTPPFPLTPRPDRVSSAAIMYLDEPTELRGALPDNAIPEHETPYMPSAPAIIQPSIPSIAGPEAYEYLHVRTPKQTPENRVPPSLDQVAQTMKFLTDLSKHKNAGMDLKELNDKSTKITELMSGNSPEEMQHKINTEKDCNKAYGEWCIAGHEAVATYHTNQAAYFKSIDQEALATIAEAHAADARGHAKINRAILDQSQGRFQGQEAAREASPVVTEDSAAVDKPVAVEAAKPVIKDPVVAQEAPGSSPTKAPAAKPKTDPIVGLQADPKTAKRIVPKPQEQPGRYGIAINRVSEMREEFSQNMKETLPVRMGGGKPRDPGGVGGR